MADVTVTTLDNVLKFVVDQNSAQQANSAILGLKKTAGKLLGALGIGFSLRGIERAVKQCVEMASAVEEMQNKFDAVFDGMEDKAEEWAENYANTVGRNTNDIKRYIADQQNLLVGFMGTDKREAAAEMAENMTSIAMDLASFANLNEDQAVDWMTKAVMGRAEAAKALGAVLNDDTRALAMQKLGLQGTYEALDQATKMQVNLQAIIEQSPDAIGDCVRSYDSYENTLRRYRSVQKEIKENIGQFFMPAYKTVFRLITNGLVSVRNFTVGIKKMGDELGGSGKILGILAGGIGSFLLATKTASIIKGLKGIADGTGLVSKVLRPVLNVLKGINLQRIALFAGFLLLAAIVEDFISFLRGDGSVIGKLLDKAGISADAFREKVKTAFANVQGVISKAVGFIKTYVVGGIKGIVNFLVAHGEQIVDLFRSVWNLVSQIFTVAFGLIKVRATVVFGALQAFWSKWGGKIKAVFSNTLGLIGRLFERLTEILKQVANFFTAIFSGDIKGALLALWEIFKNVFGALWDIVKTIFTNVWTFIGDKVIDIKNSIVDGFQTAIDWITSLPEQAVQWGADIISAIADGIRGAIGKIGEAVGGVIDGVRAAFGLEVSGNTGNGKTSTSGTSSQPGRVSRPTVSRSTTTNSSKTVSQNVNINNTFNGDRASQRNASSAMNKSAKDVTSELARGLAYS